jgi:hypothetical protein
MTEDGERFLDLKQELEDNPFYQVSERRSNIENALWILRRNFDLLEKFVEEVAEDKQSALKGYLSEKMDVEVELYRLTHNYLSSYYTQFQLAITFRDSLLNSESEERYYDLMQKYDIRPTSDFLLGSRAYIQHQGLLRQSRRYNWNQQNDDELVEVVLLTENLLEIDRWNQRAEQFIRSQGDAIRLVDVIESHHPDILNLHEELWDVAMNQYEDEFKDYKQKQDEMNQILQKESED